MACEAKIAIVLVVLITATKLFNAACGNPDDIAGASPTAESPVKATSAEQAPAEKPEHTPLPNGRSAKTAWQLLPDTGYQTELCNTFYQFWSNNSNVLRLRTTDGDFGTSHCTWFRARNYDAIGVNVSEWIYFFERKEARDQRMRYWKFGTNNSMWRVDGKDIEVHYLLYKENDSSCGVIGSEYYMYGDEDLKASLEQDCQEEPGTPRCKIQPLCIPHPTDEKHYLCSHHPNVDLLVSENRSEVPPNCTAFYKDAIGNRPENNNTGIDDCKPERKEVTELPLRSQS